MQAANENIKIQELSYKISVLFKKMLINPEYSHIFFTLIFGILFIFTIPQLLGFDEEHHYLRAYQLSELQFKGVIVDGTSGAYLPENVYGEVNKENKEFPSSKRKFFLFTNTAFYPPLGYIPTIIAIKAVQIFDIKPQAVTYAARIMNLICWIFLSGLAIRIIPRFKWLLYLVCMLPTSIYVSATITPDPVVIGLSMLYLAYILKLKYMTEDKISSNQMIKLVILASLCAFAKGYIFLSLLVFLIPFKKFNSLYSYLITTFSVVLLSVLVNASWLSFIKDVIIPLKPYASYEKQAQYIIEHPLNYITALLKLPVRTVLFFLHQNQNCQLGGSNSEIIAMTLNSINNGSFLDFIIKQKRVLGLFFNIFMGIIYSSYLYIYTILNKEDDFKINLAQKLIIVLIYLATFITVSTNQYLTWNYVGSENIEGVQPRYFIPILPAMLLLLHNYKFKSNFFNRNKYNLTFAVVLTNLTLSYLILIFSYYS